MPMRMRPAPDPAGIHAVGVVGRPAAAQRAREKHGFAHLQGAGFPKDADVVERLPDRPLPDGARLERVMIAGQDQDRAREPAQNVRRPLHFGQRHGMVLEGVAGQDREIHLLLAGDLRQPLRREEARLAHLG
jgi:hypothetical protein